MSALEYFKLALSLVGYLVCAPILAWAIRGSDAVRRVCIAATIALTAIPPTWFTLTVDSQDWYRGHVRGFEFSVIEILALALLLGARWRRDATFRWLPPGSIVFGAYWLFCTLSVIGTIDAYFGMMAVLKYAKIWLIYVGLFNAIRSREDLLWLVGGAAAALHVELLVALKDRYLSGAWRVMAWFEHPNPLAMWAYMLGLPVLAIALAGRLRTWAMAILLSSYLAAVLLVIFTVSRASLAAIAAGTLLVALASMAVRFRIRQVLVLPAIAVAGVVIALVASDTIMERVQAAEADRHESLRSVLDRQSAAMLHDHPFGVGWNNFGFANSRPHGTRYSVILEEWTRSRGHRIDPAFFERNPLTESLYWLHLAENGYVATVFYLVFLGMTLWWALAASWRWRGTTAGALAAGILIALLLAYGHGTVERILTQTKNITTWLILVAVIARLRIARGGFHDPGVGARPAGARPEVGICMTRAAPSLRDTTRSAHCRDSARSGGR